MPSSFIFGHWQEAFDEATAGFEPNARVMKGSVSDLAELDQLRGQRLCGAFRHRLLLQAYDLVCSLIVKRFSDGGEDTTDGSG